MRPQLLTTIVSRSADLRREVFGAAWHAECSSSVAMTADDTVIRPASDEPWLVVLAASAGGVAALSQVLGGLPSGLPVSVIVLQHRPSTGESHLEEILRRRAHMPVVPAVSGHVVVPGVVYLARPDLHLTIRPDKRFDYTDGRRIRFLFSSANPLLETAAPAFRRRLIAVVLTGTGSDASDGVQAVKAHGGTVIVQDRTSSNHWGMPAAALNSGAVDYVLPLDAIAAKIEAIVHGHPVTGAMEPV